MATSENSQQPDLLPMELSDPALSAEDSHAKTLVMQERAQAWQESAADYGANTPELLANFDPTSCSWRTSQLCLDGDLELFSETWPRSGMMQNGTAYQLPPLVRLTAGTDSGLWQTPVADDSVEREKGKWNSRGEPKLSAQVKMWPTPQASDNRDRGNLSSGAVQRRRAKGKQIMLSQSVSEVSGNLNPFWTEWLMGFPIGHTALKP